MVILLLLFGLGCSADGAVDYEAAGIVAYTRIQGQAYVLLAEHIDSDRGWGSFGGSREGTEPIETTALREFREETRCVYDSLLVVDLAGQPTVSDGIFLSFVIEVPYVPAQVFESRPALPGCQGPAFEERGPWIWVPLEAVVHCLEEGASTSVYELPAHLVPNEASNALWSSSAVILKKAVSEGLLD
jgi:8-oxo-dGTP pyrophosphatase MutT (NUDIX family)